MNKKVILHVITGLDTGGAEMMLFKLLSAWVNCPLESRVVSLSAGGSMRARIESLGVPLHSLEMRRGRPSLLALSRLQRIIGRTKPALIQGWMYHGNLAASVASWFNRDAPPIAWNVRQSLYDVTNERPLTRLVIRANARMSSRAAAIVYNSRTSALQHEAAGFDATLTCIIPNGFDTDLFHPSTNARNELRRELGLNSDTIVIGLIARYHPMKDHRTFFNAAQLLVRDYPNVRFVLAGLGMDDRNFGLISIIDELALRDCVILLGERRDTSRINAALDIATSSSAWGEGFSNVVAEAMSCGVPCVVTDVGDSAMIVGETGRVVARLDPESLATGWRSLIALGSDGLHSLGIRARQRVIDKFSLGPVAKQYEDIYERLIAQPEI